MRARTGLSVALLLLASAETPAQSMYGGRAGVARIVTDSLELGAFVSGATFRVETPFRRSDASRKYAPLASAIVPGSGQALLGNSRFVGYLAIETIGWLMYGKSIRERGDEERRFKEIARDVARAHFSTTRPDGNWAYYEWMRDYAESGVYSQTSSGRVVPDTNPDTYNGKRWQTLQGIYPTEAEALEHYEQLAIKPDYLWSWKNHGLEKDIFDRYTDKRNDANRSAVRYLLVIGANHFLSMVDAFTTFRLQAQTEQDGRTSVGASVKW